MTLRRILLSRVTTLLFVVGLITTITSYTLVRFEASKFLDVQLAEVAMNAGKGLEENFQPKAESESEDKLIVQIWDSSGQLIQASGPPVEIPQQTDLGYFDVTVEKEEWRVFRAQDTSKIVQISQRWSARKEIAARAALGAMVPFIIAFPLAWLMITFSVNRTLRGLGDLSQEIGKRSIDSAAPLKTEKLPAEIIPLISAMNILIARHQQAFELQRRFISDAAHELRTPLAAFQLQVDNLRTRSQSASMSDLLIELDSGVKRATRLVGQLLVMARAESPPVDAFKNIDLGLVLRDLISDFLPLLDAKDLTISLELSEPTYIDANRSDIETLLRVLVENSVAYTLRGGQISVVGKEDDKKVILDIIDTGDGIARAALPFIFDRFFRSAPAGTEGTGLGLSIARSIADRNHWHLSIQNRIDASGVIASIKFAKNT